MRGQVHRSPAFPKQEARCPDSRPPGAQARASAQSCRANTRQGMEPTRPPGPRSESRGDSKGLWSPSMGSSCFARLLRWMGFAAPGSQTGSPALLTPAPPLPLSRDFKQWGQVPGSLQPPNCLRPRLQPHLAIKPTSGVSSAARCQWPGAGDRCTDGRRAPREAGRGLTVSHLTSCVPTPGPRQGSTQTPPAAHL